MAARAAATEELHRATTVYFVRPRGEKRYGRWAVLAQEVAAEEERPMMPRRIGGG